MLGGVAKSICALRVLTLTSCSVLVSTTGFTDGHDEASPEAGVPLVDAGSGTDGDVEAGPAVSPVLLASGGRHTCAALDEKMWCWGDNGFGQLGSDVGPKALSPVVVSGLPPGSISAIGAGYEGTCAILAGEVWCWGSAGSGALGPGANAASTLPVKIVGLPGPAIEVGGGYGFACALLSSGRVYCWGNNAHGELGDGTTVSHKQPSAVVGAAGIEADFARLSVGGDHACAVTRAGVPLCWGHNDNGVALGYATSDDGSMRALPVGGWADKVERASIAAWHGCATVGGAAWCWGTGTAGELGNGETTNSMKPVAVSGLADGVTLLETTGGPDDGDSTCAVRNGKLYCWGNNAYRQLGTSDTNPRSVPTEITSLPGTVVGLAGAGAHWCVVLASREIRCWGAGGAGQLGDGAGVDRPVTVAVTLP